MGTMQYYLKGSALPHPTSPNLIRVDTLGAERFGEVGSALPHPTSPNLSAPRVSTLMSQSAVGLDMFNPGCITAPERILEEFLSLSLSLFHGFGKVIYLYNGV